MIRRAYLLVLVPLLLHVGFASAQEYPLMELIAKKVIKKYQTSSCQELAQQKSHPPTGQQAQMEQRAVQDLRNDIRPAGGPRNPGRRGRGQPVHAQGRAAG